MAVKFMHKASLVTTGLNGTINSKHLTELQQTKEKFNAAWGYDKSWPLFYYTAKAIVVSNCN